MKYLRFVYWVLRLYEMRFWEKIAHGETIPIVTNGQTLTVVEAAKYASELKHIFELYK